MPAGVGGNKCPGLELVAVIRAVELNDFAVGNSITELTKKGTVEDWKHRCIPFRKHVLRRNKKKINTQSRKIYSRHHPT